MTPAVSLLYLRTPLGRAAAFSPEATLSPDLKSMLKAVDGKTSVSALVMLFPEADAAELLAQLEVAGLIRLRHERADDAHMATAAQPPETVWPESNFADSGPTHPAHLEGLATAPLSAALPNDEPVPRTGLPLIVDLMSTFVLTHLPQQAFTVLAKLEGVRTLSGLQTELPDYIVLAKTVGAAGLVHLAEVTERVQEATAAA